MRKFEISLTRAGKPKCIRRHKMSALPKTRKRKAKKSGKSAEKFEKIIKLIKNDLTDE